MSLRIAMEKAGIVPKIRSNPCWGCGKDITEQVYHWPQYEEQFCSFECCQDHPLEAEPKESWPITKTIKPVLDAWGLPISEKFLSPDGLAVSALLCNAAAKFIDEEFYFLKPTLVEASAKKHTNVWRDGDVVYFETCVGQLSFHVFEDGDFDLLPYANGREWRGGWMQDEARSIAVAFLGNGDDELEFSLRRFLNLAQGCGL